MPHNHSPFEGIGQGQDRTGELVLALFPEFVKAANRRFGCVFVPIDLAQQNWPLVCLLLRYGALPPEERKLPELCQGCQDICSPDTLKEALVDVACKLMVANSFNLQLMHISLHHLAEERPDLASAGASWSSPRATASSHPHRRVRTTSLPLRATAMPFVTSRS